MKNRIFLFCLLTALAVSCVKDQQEVIQIMTDDQEFYATIEEPGNPVTKVFADSQLRVLWNTDDRVSIFNKSTYNRQYRFDGQDGDNSGSFKVVPNDDFVTSNPLDYVYSVYPYNENTKISNDGEITVYLPSEQSYRENSFGLGANMMIAIADEDELMFKNLCGYIAIKLYGDNICVQSISIKGNNNEPLAGKATVSAQMNAVPMMAFNAAEATKEITLTFDSPVTLGTSAETASAFWFAIPPTSFSNGITLSVRDNMSGVFEKSTTKCLEIKRNTLSKMAALEVNTVSQEIEQPLTLQAIEDGEILFSNPVGLEIGYSTDGINWVLTSSDIRKSLSAGERIMFRGDNESYTSGFFSSSEKRTTIECTSACYIYGNIMSLISSIHYGSIKELKGQANFGGMFEGNSNIFNHPGKALILPATVLSEYCYANMFSGCTSLTTAPALPATTLAQACYYSMFSNCTSLTSAPELPATNLKPSCYRFMFSNCSSLKSCPVLPAKSLTSYCYDNMFTRCTSLRVAPDLPATELAEACYLAMFSQCENLESAPQILPATNLANSCYQSMFSYCYNLQTAPILPAEILQRKSYRLMFYHCSSLNYIKAMFLGPGGALESWVEGVAETGTFIKNEKCSWENRGVNAIPVGWQILKEGSTSGINVIKYMEHLKGQKAVPFVLLPDGFVKEELPTFRARAIESIESLFSVEPFRTYRDYFNVYIIEVPSEESGASITDGQGNITTQINTFFESRWGASSYADMRADDSKVFQVASICPEISSGEYQLSEVPIALLVNDTRYGGICVRNNRYESYCIIPYAHAGETIRWDYPSIEAVSDIDNSLGYRTVTSSEISEMGVSYGDWTNIILHELGGHAFGRLDDEYWYTDLSASSSTPSGMNLSSSYSSVPWQELLDNKEALVSINPLYNRVGVFQGGGLCMYGRWRNERISCMIDNRPYFSAWQRYLITKRIMTIAGEGDNFSFDSWLAQDETIDPIRDNPRSTPMGYGVRGPVHYEKPLLPPIVLDE